VFLALVLVASLPLAGVGLLTFHLTKQSVLKQVQSNHAQLAAAAGSMVRNYLQTATTKLKSIAQMIRKDEDPRIQTTRLNKLLDPPDLFLEVSYWTVGKNPEVQAQVQQMDYNSAQNGGNLSNRAFNS
jgi:hypothetical protein